MSASSKKKLRKEQEAAKMTERQQTEQKEAKKLKLYTTIFAVALAVIVVFAVWSGVSQTITSSGVREKNTVALTVGEEKLSNAELNYYFIDAVNEFYSTYGSYASLFGLDVTTPLNEQITNEEEGTTWADDFVESAKTNAHATIALANEAKANGFVLTEADIAEIENNISTLTVYASVYNYPDAESYLQAIYGNGATIESYREYCELNYLANAYYNSYSETLTYDDAALRAAEAGMEHEYNAYSYNSYYVNVSSFLEGGTTDENGNTTYSDEERAAAVAAAEAAAKELTTQEITGVDELDAAIAELSINAEAESAPTSTAYTDTMYSSVNSVIRDWVADSAREPGDLGYFANESTSTAEDGTETTTVSGYYVVLFNGVNDNTYPLVNVRHILVGFEGGTYDETTGLTTYSDEEKAAAMVKAEELLAQWKSGKASEETFATLANENSTDSGSNTNGGLYENVYPGQMVTNFNTWCFEEGRKTGDTGIVESDYGYHIMYYVGDSDISYRDYMVESDLRTTDTSDWYTSLTEALTVTEGNTEYLSLDLVLSAG